MRYKAPKTILNALLVLLVIVFNGCKKDSSNNDTNQDQNTSYTQYGTPFANVPNTQDAIIYQANTRDFPNGNLQGVLSRIDSIKALGVNVLYLLPVYPVGVLKASYGMGSPYSVKDFKAVGAEYGTLTDLRNLVDAAHSRNMAVMMDWVANQTSWDNAWISNKNWYQQDTNGNIIYPAGTNWTDVAALNYNNQDMRNAMIDAMKYWVYNANIDGFRCDAADYIPFDFWVQANTALKGITTHKLLMLAEGTRNDHFKAGFQLMYGMAFYYGLKDKIFAAGNSVTTLQNFNTSEYVNAQTGSQVVRYTSNHDAYKTDGSPLTLFGGKTGSMATFLVAAYMKGVPMLYNGQEVGATQTIDFFSRTPINWTTNPDMTAEYKKILNFRQGSDAVKNGQLNSYSSDDVVVFMKYTDTQKVLVVANLRGNAVTYTIPPSLAGTWKNAFTSASVTLGAQIALQPYQHMVLTQ